MVKAGLALSLFGGVSKFADDVDRVRVRGDIHVLVVGDPGLGKSQVMASLKSTGIKSRLPSRTPRPTYTLAVDAESG